MKRHENLYFGFRRACKRDLWLILDHNKTEKEIKIEGFITFLENDDESIYGKNCINIKALKDSFNFIVGIGTLKYKLSVEQAIAAGGYQKLLYIKVFQLSMMFQLVKSYCN